MNRLSVGESRFGFEACRGAYDLAREDAERSERLRLQCRLPDHDERPELDPPPTCEVCGGEVVRAPRGRKATKASICRPCSLKGWRSRRCACGNLLRTWDIGPPGWHGGPICRDCRTARYAEAAP